MLIPRTLGLASILIAAPVFASAQLVDGVADPLLRPNGSAAIAADGDAVIFGSGYSTLETPFLQLMRRAAGSLDYSPSDVLVAPEFNAATNLFGVAMAGDLVAHQVWQSFSTETRLFVHERGPAGWASQSLQLYPRRVLAHGNLTAISGQRIVSIHAPQVFSRTYVNVIERSAAGLWEIVDTVETSIRSPWVDYASSVVLDGDVVALGGFQGIRTGAISVCEPNPAGDWQETAILRPPSPGFWSVEAVGLSGGRLAAVRSTVGGSGLEYVLHAFERRALGDWVITARRPLPTPVGAPTIDNQTWLPAWTLTYDGTDLLVSNEAETTIYRAVPGSPVTPLRQIRGLGTVIGLDGRIAVGADGTVARAVDLVSQPGDIDVSQLAGQATCPGTGASRLRLYREFGSPTQPFVRAVAEVVDAPVGATALLFRSSVLASAPAASTGLCLDRQTLRLVDAPRTIGVDGSATFSVPSNGPTSGTGWENAHHLQAALLGGGGGLSVTGGVAWIP